MNQYYYITNSRPNENKYMKPIKPQHKPSFPCKLVSDVKTEDTKVEEVIAAEPVAIEPAVIEDPVITVEAPVSIVETEEEPKKKRRGRKKAEEITETVETATEETAE